MTPVAPRAPGEGPPEAPAWLDELALSADGPPWLAMGLSRIAEADWLQPDDHRADELAERRRLLAERHDEVFLALPGTEAAGAELLDLVLAWETEHRPDLRGRTPAGGPGTGDVHPLEAAGRRTQEDLVLMVPRDGGHHLDAAVLCAPSHWRLADKLGGSAAAIHGPVPGYRQELAPKVDRFLDRLRPGVIVARRNWSVHPTPTLFAPDPPPPQALRDDQLPTHLWLRTERQTLRALPRTGAVVFTIRVQHAPFAALASAPEVAARLAARLRAQPAAVTEMNGLAPHVAGVVRWLESLA